MKKWKILIDCVLLCCLLSLVACRFDPLGLYDDSDDTGVAAVIAGFTPAQIQQIVDDIKNDKAVLPVSLSVPAYSFYRFDYSNVAGGHRGSTILSYDQAVGSAPYGIETTARVLIFEAMKARAGYSFDFFAFSDGLAKDRIGSVINAIAAQFSDTEFLLNSSQNIGSTTLVMQAVNDLVGSLPLPAPADFAPVAIASPAVDLDLKPDFSDLPVTTLTTLFLNEDLHTMYASMTVVGLANYSLFTSNVPAVSQPRPSFRLHKTDTEHNITRDYLVSLAPIGATGSVVINPASPPAVISGIASAQLAISQSGDGQKLVFTYSGDRGVAQTVTAESEKLVLAFTYRDVWDKDSCESSKDLLVGPLAYLNRAGPQKFAGESFSFVTPATKLLCIVVADNKQIATFTAEQGVAATADFSVPAGQVATLACYIIPPAAQDVAEQARAVLMTEFASETRPLDELETAGWNGARAATLSVELSGDGRSISVPAMFKTWFYPVGTYVYNTSLDEFTPQVFREIAAPASPEITLDMNGYSEEPRYAFSLPIYAAPMVTGITSGAFNTAKTFSIQVVGTRLYEYSLDNGTTWNDYSGPVTLSSDGSFQVIARDKANNFTSTPVTLAIDTAAPGVPTITGISSGIYADSQTFTITGSESGATIYYSIDNEVTSQIYTEPVTISAEGTATCTAWQIDASGNIGAKTAPVTVTIDSTAPQAPTITGIATGTFKTSQTFTVTGSEPGGSLYYSLDNGLTESVYTEPVTISAEGTATCTAWQIDAAGNSSARASAVTLTVDKTAPQAPAITGITSGIFAPGQTFTVTGAEPGGVLYYSLDDGLTSSIYTEPVTISAEGTATCTAWQIDAAENVGARATPIVVTIDSSAPQAPTITGITSGIFASTQTFTITGAEPGGTLYYSFDNGLTSFIYTEPVTITLEGTATCTAWQVDSAGKIGQKAAAVTVTIDTAAPQAPTISGIATGTYAGDQTFTVTAAEAGGTLYYSLDNGLTNVAYSGPVTISAEGTATCTAWQIDAAGNTGAKAAAVTVTIDKTGPQAPTITGITSGIFAADQAFTVTAAEPGGTLYYSLDDGLTSTLYSGPVTIAPGVTATCTAWQVDDAANVGQKAAPISLTVLQVTLAELQPTIGFNNGILYEVQITGSGFVSGIVPSLVRAGQTTVTGTDVVVNDSTSLSCNFNLTDTAVGVWDLSLAYSDVELASVTGMFTVQSKTWRKSLGGLANEAEVYCVNAVEGNGVVIAGTTNSYLDQIPSTTPGTLAGSDIWIARLDDAGELLWSRRIGGSGTDHCSGLIALGNGYILAGDTTSTDGDMAFNQDSVQRAMLMKLDGNGVPDTTTPGVCPVPSMLPSGANDARGGIKNTADGGCIMAGVCTDGSYKYAWAVKFTPNLEQMWDVRITGNGPDTLAFDVAQKADGNYLLCGFTSFPYGSFGASAQSNPFFNEGFVAEISTIGQIVNSRCFGGSGTDSCTGVVPMPNGDFYVIGTTGSSDGFCPLPANRGTEDVMIFSVSADFTGTSIPLCLGGSGVDTGLRGQLAADGGLLFAGQTNSIDGDVSGNHGATGDFWFGKVSQSAVNLEWQKCFGGTADDYLSGFVITEDGGYLLSGHGLSTDGDLADTGHQVGNDDFIIIREAVMPVSSVLLAN